MTQEELDCFNDLKRCLTEAPTLIIPNLDPDTHPFVVVTDASKRGLGAILMQKADDGKLHPIAYSSRMTDEKEQLRYSTYQLEMAAVVYALNVFKHYLRFKKIPFILRTDCQALCWLLKCEHDSTIRKWIIQLTEFDFTIEYVRGAENPADVLSRLPIPLPEGLIVEQSPEPLYSEDHGKLQQFIISCLNKRTSNKQERRTNSTTNSSTTSVSVFSESQIVQPLYICGANKQNHDTHTETCSLTTTCCVNNLKEFLQQTFLEIWELQTSLNEHPQHKNENQCCVLTPEISQLHPVTSPNHEPQVHDSKEDEQYGLDEKHCDDTIDTTPDNITMSIDEDCEEITEAEKRLAEKISRSIIVQSRYLEENEEIGDYDDEDLLHELPQAEKESILLTLEAQLQLMRTEFNNDNFRKWQNSCPKVLKIINDLSRTTDMNQPIHSVYKIIEGILHVNNRKLQEKYNHHKLNKRIVTLRKEWSKLVPEVNIPGTTLGIKWCILREFHGLPTTGHLGCNSTYFMLRQHFFWKGMLKDVRKWIDACETCQKCKVGKNNSVGEHRSVLQTRPFEVVSIDLVGPFPETPNGNTFILTVLDHFSRYPLAIPIANKTEEVVATALKIHLFMAFPFWPRKILSDKGSEFNNKVINSIYKQLGVSQILTSHDNPRANSVERFHRFMNASIRTFINKKILHKTWDLYVDTVVFTYRCTTNKELQDIHPSTRFFGRWPIRPIDYLLGGNIDEQKVSCTNEHVQEILSTFREVYDTIHHNQRQQAIKNMYHTNKQLPVYNIDDMVYVWRLHDPGKQEWRYDGPFPIAEKISDISYRVCFGKYKTDRPHKNKQKGDAKYKVVTIRHLQPYQPFMDEFPNTAPLFEEDNDDIGVSPDVEQTPVVGMMTIIPYWAWDTIKNDKQAFSVAKIIAINGDNVIIHKYGNNTNNNFSPQAPGYLYRSNQSIRTKYTDTPQTSFKNKPYAPFQNQLKLQDNRLNHSVNHKLTKKDCMYSGFTLTQSKMIPIQVLEAIDKNKHLNKEIQKALL